MKLMVEVEVPDNLEPCAYGCMDKCPFSYYNDDTRQSECNHLKKVGDELECLISRAMKKKEDICKNKKNSACKDSECKAYIHTYKCTSENCDSCEYRSTEKKEGEKMAKYCPHTHGKVVYLVCQECDDRICEQQKYEPKEQKQNNNCSKCICDTCINKTQEYMNKMFGREVRIIRCKIFHNALINSLQTKTECEYHNVDVSQEKICLNCEHYLGGGDWGLSCRKDYYKLPNATSKACEDFEWKKEEKENE